MPWKNAPRLHVYDARCAFLRKSWSPTASLSPSRIQADEQTVWHPERRGRPAGRTDARGGALRDGRYEFELPPQIDPGWLDIKIGDAISRVRDRADPAAGVDVSVVASVTFRSISVVPRSQPEDVRGERSRSSMGSTATFTATASRDLKSAQVDGKSVDPRARPCPSPPAKIEGSRKIEFRWQDQYGLAGKEPFVLASPAVRTRHRRFRAKTCRGKRSCSIPSSLSFKVRRQDDFGIKEIGLDWQGIDSPLVTTPAKGERMLSAGGNRAEACSRSTELFRPNRWRSSPSPCRSGCSRTDYFPGRRESIHRPTRSMF